MINKISLENILWVFDKIRKELIYYKRWLISFIPSWFGYYLRNNHWGLAQTGAGVKIDDRCWFTHPEKIYIGHHTKINKSCMINGAGKVEIGSNTIFGPGVYIWSQNHEYKNASIKIIDQGYVYKKVVICDDVWLAARSIILPGVTVGKGAVVGAGSLVTKNVAPYSVVAGVPARKIGDRT